MARMKVPVEETRKRRRARELRRKNSEAKSGSDDANKGEVVCAICDNGGSLTCCDGGCRRSFHLDDSEGSTCRLALGLTKDEAKTITDTEQDFVCKNCKYSQHQCFACGLLGSSDPSSLPEVFQCGHDDDDDCGRFYHPKCVAKLLYSDGEAATLFEHQVAAGLGFVCPVHECCVCKKGENKDDEGTQFAVCRRCPATYHRKCLPKEILFKTRKGPNGPMRRAWDGVLPDRLLIYCMKHEIVRKLRTPARDHIIFPDAEKLGAKKKAQASPMEQQDVVSEGAEQRRHPFSEPSESPPFAASNKNQCVCYGHMDSFAPKSLFMRPQPGSCGWIDDDE